MQEQVQHYCAVGIPSPLHPSPLHPPPTLTAGGAGPDAASIVLERGVHGQGGDGGLRGQRRDQGHLVAGGRHLLEGGGGGDAHQAVTSGAAGEEGAVALQQEALGIGVAAGGGRAVAVGCKEQGMRGRQMW